MSQSGGEHWVRARQAALVRRQEPQHHPGWQPPLIGNSEQDRQTRRQLRWIISEAARQLPGYEGADWEFHQPIPSIEALYEKV